MNDGPYRTHPTLPSSPPRADTNPAPRPREQRRLVSSFFVCFFLLPCFYSVVICVCVSGEDSRRRVPSSVTSKIDSLPPRGAERHTEKKERQGVVYPRQAVSVSWDYQTATTTKKNQTDRPPVHWQRGRQGRDIITYQTGFGQTTSRGGAIPSSLALSLSHSFPPVGCSGKV